MNFQMLILIAPPILLALTVHEFAHAYTAYRFGDDTARKLGRLSLNPLRHLDPLGTIMIFLVHFGWAKPVPVNPSRLKSPKQDLLWISAAGPLSNMALALASGILLRIITITAGPSDQHSFFMGIVFLVIYMSMQINLALAVFNILPIAPLDGSKILSGLLPVKYADTITWLERHGPFILIGLIIIGQATGVPIFGKLIWPFVALFSRIFGGV